MSIASTMPPHDISADELKNALLGLINRIESFILRYGSAQVMAGSDSILASFSIQRLAGADVIIQDGVELVDPDGERDGVLVQGSVVYISRLEADQS